jgi:mannose/fructose/N-acetylgalactosamine-specific phosphotransferase system component IID
MKTTLKLIAWLVCFILTMNVGFECLTMSSTIANIVGIFILGVSISYSIETKCFTQFKKQKENESNQED